MTVTPSDAISQIADAEARAIFLPHEWVTISPDGAGGYTVTGVGWSSEPVAAADTQAASAAVDSRMLTELSTVRVTRWLHGEEQLRALAVTPAAYR
ncbi:hypothetical protein AB0I72_19130 [Nocardiopsis sp. NPDC049922]|uniref:hypothetical protein n=1 Tax=Nocardiopsis sp. NPDC049922 TaxID=3155157 RepID=UPI0034043E42